MSEMRTEIRPMAVAGIFYDSDPARLRDEISRLLDGAEEIKLNGKIHGLIVPHAGFAYSGNTAAHAYKHLAGSEFRTAVVISPSHREYFRGISVFSGTHYETPLGEIPLDVKLREELVRGERIIESSTRGHGDEHAIEVQLPFLQSVGKKFSLLPVVIGDQRREYCEHLGKKLGEILKGRKALIIASSDLSHFHNSESAEKLDRVVAGRISKFDHDGLMRDLEMEKTEACGGGPIVSAMIAARLMGADRIEMLHQCDSGDVTGEHDSVVGYLSAAILESE